MSPYTLSAGTDLAAPFVSGWRVPRLFRADVVAAVGQRQFAGLVDVDEFVDEFVVRFALALEALEPFQGLLVDAYLGMRGEFDGLTDRSRDRRVDSV